MVTLMNSKYGSSLASEQRYRRVQLLDFYTSGQLQGVCA